MVTADTSIILPVLAVRPTAHVFGKAYEAQLRQRLRQIEQGTAVTPVLMPANAQLTNDGVTIAGHYRYTTVALIQLAHTLSPGMGQLLLDVSGHTRRPHMPRREYSLAAAVDVFNRVLSMRFERVRDRQFVRFRPDRSIDGIVGPKYRYLSNQGFYERVSEAVPKTAVFYEGLLYGRHLVLRYIIPAARYVVNLGGQAESYVPGFYFMNSEIGEGAIRAAPILVREGTGDACTGPFLDRVKHQGGDFDIKLGRLIQTAVLVATTDHTAQLTALASVSLGMGKSENRDKIRKHVRHVLIKYGLSQGLADRVLTSALVQGSGGDPADPNLIERQLLVLTRRTPYDVFTALMREARNLSVGAREVAEQAAYALLVGKFSFSSRGGDAAAEEVKR